MMNLQPYCIDGRISAHKDAAGQAYLELTCHQARATIYLNGAHVTQFSPIPGAELLWMSQSAVFAEGTAIRGGIPICWPWFGVHKSDASMPKHGYARVLPFGLVKSEVEDNYTHILLQLDASSAPYQNWRNLLTLTVDIRLEPNALSVSISTTNISGQHVAVSQALHNYFAIDNTESCRLSPIKATSYRDNLDGLVLKQQQDEFVLDGAIDRVYLSPAPRIQLKGNKSGVIQLECQGSTDLVVWNPWQEGERNIADFHSDGYKTMICVEPANALDNAIVLGPNQSCAIQQKISLC